MEYVHAALLLDESGKELNEANITAVLEAAGIAVEESRVKALVAAMEGVSLDELGETALEPAGEAGETHEIDGAGPGTNGGGPGGEPGVDGEETGGNIEIDGEPATADGETGSERTSTE